MYVRAYAIVGRCEQGQPNERYPNPDFYVDFADADSGRGVQVSVPASDVLVSGVMAYVGTRQMVVLEAHQVIRPRQGGGFNLSWQSLRVTPVGEFDNAEMEKEQILLQYRQSRAQKEK